jgi:hypothetical protein
MNLQSILNKNSL